MYQREPTSRFTEPDVTQGRSPEKIANQQKTGLPAVVALMLVGVIVAIAILSNVPG